MTKDEALRLALEALEINLVFLRKVKPFKGQEDLASDCVAMTEETITAIKAALEAKDEPVAWGMKKNGVIIDVICPDEHDLEEGSYTVPLYTTPQRTWVGLTKMELVKCGVFPWGNSYQLYQAIESKLKEKNHG